jgi:hypothetical protein
LTRDRRIGVSPDRLPRWFKGQRKIKKRGTTVFLSYTLCWLNLSSHRIGQKGPSE